jgi:hypothetical protein
LLLVQIGGDPSYGSASKSTTSTLGGNGGTVVVDDASVVDGTVAAVVVTSVGGITRIVVLDPDVVTAGSPEDGVHPAAIRVTAATRA